MTKALLIIFIPINRFFFGGSYSLGDSFYAESLKFPQPTTILGCIRNTILIQNRLYSSTSIIDSFLEEDIKLTGTSMVEGLDSPDDNFGVIENISPVFIVKFKDDTVEDFLFTVPSDIMKDVNNSLKCFGYSKNMKAKSNYSERINEYAILVEKESKLDEVQYFGGRDFWEKYINGESLPYNPDYEEGMIFIPHTSVGISRKNKIAVEGMFYTKIDYSLKSGFAFGVIVWLKEDAFKFQKGVVFLGGEQSTFFLKILQVEKYTQSHLIINMMVKGKCNLSENLKCCNDKDKLISLSPIVLDKHLGEELAKAMEYRIVKSMQATRIIKRAGALKSEAICLIPAGAVFYPMKSINLTNNWPIPHKIGYNYIMKIRR